MDTSQRAAIEASKKLNIPYEIIHKNRIAVKVNLNPSLYFILHYAPFNRQDIVHICQDKDLSYTIFKDLITVPKWVSYMDPKCNEKYRDMVEFESIRTITNNIVDEFNLPVIIKPNKGSRGRNTVLCYNKREIRKALRSIFKRNKNYDYIALAQESIDISREFRVIVYKGKIKMIYEKDISEAQFVGNLSPLHYENSKALLIENQELTNRLQKFIDPLFKNIKLVYSGLDIAIDQNDKLFLIEANKSPAFNIFERDNGLEPLINLYTEIFTDIQQKNEL